MDVKKFMEERRAQFKRERHISSFLDGFDIASVQHLSDWYIGAVQEDFDRFGADKILASLEPVAHMEFLGKFNKRFSHEHERASSEGIALRTVLDPASYGDCEITALNICGISEAAYHHAIYYCDRVIR